MQSIPDQYKTQEISLQAVDDCSFVLSFLSLDFVPEQYKTSEMSDKVKQHKACKKRLSK